MSQKSYYPLQYVIPLMILFFLACPSNAMEDFHSKDQEKFPPQSVCRNTPPSQTVPSGNKIQDTSQIIVYRERALFETQSYLDFPRSNTKFQRTLTPLLLEEYPSQEEGEQIPLCGEVSPRFIMSGIIGLIYAFSCPVIEFENTFLHTDMCCPLVTRKPVKLVVLLQKVKLDPRVLRECARGITK